MLSKRFWVILFLAFWAVALFIRVDQLGYSHFYGDETKTLYVRKDVSATDFMFSQRKGPVQFLAVWEVEKLTGGFSELYVRIPFALAGWLAILAVFLLVSKLFNTTAGFFSSMFFASAGLYTAFSRTAQYQSFLLLFGILSVYFVVKALEKDDILYYSIGGILMAFALLSHYDAVFFFIPCLLFALGSPSKVRVRKFFYFLIPALLIPGIFYLPYFVKGYFSENTWGYLLNRFSGRLQLPNSNFWTFYSYSPSIVYFIPLALGFLAFLSDNAGKIKALLYWFLIPLVFFTFFVGNPGTHIQAYFLPLYILSGFGVSHLLVKFNSIGKKYYYLFTLPFLLLAGLLLFLTATIYLPRLSKGYPWTLRTKFAGVEVAVPRQRYQLFLYGFPYNRGWDQIREYFLTQKGVRGVYTNDNDVMAKYYLREFDYTPPGSNFLPPYFIDVSNNLDGIPNNLMITNAFALDLYEKVFEVPSGSSDRTVVYKLRKGQSI